MLRANVEPEKVAVIPNAVDTSMFTPNPAGLNPSNTGACMRRRSSVVSNVG